MKNSLWKLLPVILGVILTQSVSAEEAGAFIPFVAVDAVNGKFDQSVRNELDRSSIGYELLTSPITAEQLKGASVLLISGGFRNALTKPKAGERDHRLYSNEEIATIDDFVKKGGTLIGAGISWPWVYPAYGDKTSESFPLNQIGEALDFSIVGQCEFDKYERKFFSLAREPKTPGKIAFSNVEFKGGYDKLIRSNKGFCGGGAKRGDGYIYIFGHQDILTLNPDFASLVFLGLSPKKRTNTDLVENDPKEAEPEEQQKPAPAIEPIPEVAVSNINPLELLAREGPNLIAWATSPLDVDVPDDFRASISLLREDMLDGQAEKGKETGMYAAGAVLCDNLISSLDMKERKQIEAKLKVAQAKERAPLSNQALEARRNYMMSWPQYEREVRQREVLSEKKGNTVEVKTRELEAKWIVTAGELRKAMDTKYSQFRASIREK